MKISFKKDDVLGAFTAAAAVAGKDTLTAGVLLNVGDEKSTITATDFETFIRTPAAFNVEESGSVCLPARSVYEIIKELPEEIALEVKGNAAVITSGKSCFKMQYLPLEEFPQFPSVEEAVNIELEADRLAGLINSTIFAAGESDSRYILNAILFEIKKNGALNVVGTNGHRMAVAGASVPLKGEARKSVVSRKTLLVLKRFLGGSGRVAVSFGKSFVVFAGEGFEIASQLLEGKYPDYNSAIPKGNGNILTANRQAFMSALKRVSLMSDDGHVILSLKGKEIGLSSKSKDLGEAKDVVSAEFTGEPVEIGFNSQYLLSGLGVLDSETATLKLDGPITPVLISGTDEASYKYIVMPIRIS